MQIKDFANVFALDGYWRYKRAEKKKHYTDKSMLTRAAVMRNWVVPLWGERSPRRLVISFPDSGMLNKIYRGNRRLTRNGFRKM